MAANVTLLISNVLCPRLTRSLNVGTAIKWSAVVIIWTAVVYGCLIFKRPASSLYDHLTLHGSIDESTNVSLPATDRHSAPVQHVYYLKTHKTGSTTVYSILAEYCRSRDLLPLLPVYIHINLRLPFSASQVLLDPNISRYDMVFNHHVYDRNIFKYLHNDTFAFTTLREPFSHFVSSFYYFKDTENFPYLKAINSSNPLEDFLADRLKYEVKGYASYTNNRQSMDLGYDLAHSFDDLPYIESFIADTEKRFQLVLITVHFHESLILLKRSLYWSTKDVLYYRKLTGKNMLNVSSDVLETYRRQHQNFSMADIKLYNHFLSVFKERISREVGLEGEVKEFETVLGKVHSFCDQTRASSSELVIEAGRWSNHIRFSYSKCKWLQLGEVAFTRHLKSVQKYILAERYKHPH